MAAPAAAEIPILAYLAIGLLALLSWIVLRGMLSAYRSTFGWLLEQLAGILDIRVRFVHVDLGGPVRALDNAFMHTLGYAAAKSEHAAGYFFHSAAVLQEWTLRELRHLADETAGTLEWLARRHIPNYVKAAFPLALVTALIAKLVRSAVHAAIPHVAKVAHAAGQVIEQTFITKVYSPTINRITKVEKIATGAIAGTATLTAGALTWPWANVHVFPRLRALERWEGHTRKRLRRLEKLLGVTAFAGLMAKVLGLPNWRCLTRGNVGRTARALCGLPTHLLNDLLGLVVDFFILTQICEVVTLLEAALEVVRPELEAFMLGANAIACYGDTAQPPAFTVAAFTEPPLQPGAIALAV